MTDLRLEGKVGLFVVLGLVLIALLLLNFSQGTSVFTSTWEVRMNVQSVSGLKEKAAVLLSGVQIGTVKSIGLANDSRTVVVTLKLLKKFAVRDDAKFVIEQIGLLGDQFIAIYPGNATGRPLPDGAVVQGREPFNLQEVARSATDLIRRFDEAAEAVGEAVRRLNTNVFNPQTFTNLSATIANARLVTERAANLTDRLDKLVEANSAPLSVGVSNFISFSERLERVAVHLDETIQTNRVGVSGTITNFQQVSASLKVLLADLEAGRGVAGGLLKDEELRAKFGAAMTNLVFLTSNLTVLSSNLNEHGLLYKPRKPIQIKTGYPGRSPFSSR